MSEQSKKSSIETWLVARRKKTIVLIIALAALIRLCYFLEVAGGPLPQQYRWDQSDMNFFDEWARTIASGDWLTDRSLHPYHIWHNMISQKYFQLYPEAATSEDPEVAGKALWEEWYGGNQFHQEPLYPYLIAATYRITGSEDPRWVYGWQMLMGVASTLLIYLLARRYFGDLTAVVAATLAIFCAPMIHFELVLLRSALIAFMGLFLVALSEFALDRDRPGIWFLTGLAFGLGALLKTTFGLFLLGLFLVHLFRWRREPKRIAIRVGWIALGLAIMLSPAIGRNVAIGAPTFSLSSVGPVTYVVNNTAGFDNRRDLVPNLDIDSIARIFHDTDGSFGAVVRGTWGTYDSAGSFASQYFQRVRLSWHPYELPNSTNFYYFRLHSIVLRSAFITFTLLSPLSLLGLILGLGQIRRLRVIYLFVFMSLFLMATFLLLSRYRTPIMVSMIPFSAFGLVRCVQWVQTKGRGVGIACSLAFVALLALTAPLSPYIRPPDYIVPYMTYYEPAIQSALGRNDLDESIRLYDEMLEIRPQMLDDLGPQTPLTHADQITYAEHYRSIYIGFAAALQVSGDVQRANTFVRRGLELQEFAERAREALRQVR